MKLLSKEAYYNVIFFMCTIHEGIFCASQGYIRMRLNSKVNRKYSEQFLL